MIFINRNTKNYYIDDNTKMKVGNEYSNWYFK